MEHSISPLPNNGVHPIVPLPTVEYSIVPFPSNETFNYSGEGSWKASISSSIKQSCDQSQGWGPACFIGVRQVHGYYHDPLGSFWNFLKMTLSITSWILTFSCHPCKVAKNGLSLSRMSWWISLRIWHSQGETEQNSLICDLYWLSSYYKAEWVPPLPSGSSHSSCVGRYI